MFRVTVFFLLLDSAKFAFIEYSYESPQSCKLLTIPYVNAFKSLIAFSMLDCARLCSYESNCLSATFDGASNDCYMFSDNGFCTAAAGPKTLFVTKVSGSTTNAATIAQTTIAATTAQTTNAATTAQTTIAATTAQTTIAATTAQTTIAATTAQTTIAATTEQTTEATVVTTTMSCQNNGTLNGTSQTCKCYGGYIGDNCERIMKDCTEGYKSGHYNDDSFAVFLIKPDLAPTAFEVQCNMKERGGVTMLMKNTEWAPNANLDMNVNWNDYKNGFGGNVMDNHWIGLQHIYYITSSRPQHLYIEITAKTGSWKGAWRKYENFKVEDEATNYRMTYTASVPWSQTDVTADPDWTQDIENGPLGDSMAGSNGAAFSTSDRDNDLDGGRNCALDYKSGWWHNACADCNPNGPRKASRTPSAVDELFWKYDYINDAIAFVEMMFRAV